MERDIISYGSDSDTVVIILHEIYGVNRHIQGVCEEVAAKGFSVVCPDFYNGLVYDYSEEDRAYRAYMEMGGFLKASDIVNRLALSLRPQYQRIFLLGHSVGATTAWLCSAQERLYDKAVAFYGSRIREHSAIRPACPVLLLTADQEAVPWGAEVFAAISVNENVTLRRFAAGHGFADPFSPRFQEQAALEACLLRDYFITDI